MLANNRIKLKVFENKELRVDDNDDDSNDDNDFLPFADCLQLNDQHFSPLRALKAPIFQFKDI